MEGIIADLKGNINSDGCLYLNQEQTIRFFKWLETAADTMKNQHNVIKLMADTLRREDKSVPEVENLL